jgi:hypothetical protein
MNVRKVRVPKVPKRDPINRGRLYGIDADETHTMAEWEKIEPGRMQDADLGIFNKKPWWNDANA